MEVWVQAFFQKPGHFFNTPQLNDLHELLQVGLARRKPQPRRDEYYSVYTHSVRCIAISEKKQDMEQLLLGNGNCLQNAWVSRQKHGSWQPCICEYVYECVSVCVCGGGTGIPWCEV